MVRLFSRCAELAASYYAGIEEVAAQPTLDTLGAAEAHACAMSATRMPASPGGEQLTAA